MQIFFLHKNPEKAARMLYYLDKKRAMKQLLEGVQLLNNCCITLKIERRPITIAGSYYAKRNFPKIFENWLLESKENMFWFYLFLSRLSFLCGETKIIYPIGLDEISNLECCSVIYSKIPSLKLTSFPNYAKSKAKGLDFTHLEDTVEAYNKYLAIQLKK